MDKTIVVPTEVLQNLKDSYSYFTKDTGQVEYNCFVFSLSEFKQLLQRVGKEQSKNLDANERKALEKLIQKLFAHEQYQREIRIPCTSLVSIKPTAGQQCLHLVDDRASNSRSIVCKGKAPFSFPALLGSQKKPIFLDGFAIHRRRTKSTSCLGACVGQNPLPCLPSNSTLPLSGKWIIDSILGKNKARNLLKNHLISLVGDMGSGRVKSLGSFSDEKISEMIHSPGLMISPWKPAAGKQRHGSHVSDSLLAPCSSTKSTSSNQSYLSSCGVPSKGILHCRWKSGLPHFEFSIDDGVDVYAANPSRTESFSRSLTDEFPDYIYTFLSRSDGSKGNGSSAVTADVIGKMKVSSCLTLDANNLKHLETECTLFVSSARHLGEWQNSDTAFRRHRGIPRRMMDVFGTRNSIKAKSNLEFDDSSQAQFLDASQKPDVAGECLCENDFLPYFELAAIVVKDSIWNESRLGSSGGWGLNFLKSSSDSCPVRNEFKSNTSVHVVIPAGLHGGPRTQIGGPSPLTERWRSGGDCDCGGWDTGCPLTVLCNGTGCSASLTPTDAHDECSSFDLFKEGSKEGEPSLSIVNVREDLNFVYFQPSLTSLQSFFIAVAFIHSRSPALHPNMCKR